MKIKSVTDSSAEELSAICVALRLGKRFLFWLGCSRGNDRLHSVREIVFCCVMSLLRKDAL